MSDQERLGEPDGGAGDDERDHDGEGRSVIGEEPADAAQRDRTLGELAPVGPVGVGMAAAARSFALLPVGGEMRGVHAAASCGSIRVMS